MDTFVTDQEILTRNSKRENALSEVNYLYLYDQSKKDAEWDRWRFNAQELERLLMQGHEPDIQRYVGRMGDCAKSLMFALEADTQGEIKHRLREAHFCHFRHCSVCQARRSRQNYRRFTNKLPDILKQENLESVRWVFLTLTAQNMPISELREGIVTMNSAWKRLMNRKEFKHILGWVRSTEVTKEDEKKTKRIGYAHPHFHVLLMVKSSYFSKYYINRSEWRKAWRESMRDHSIISVDVRVADRYKGNKLVDNALMKSISETLKYSVKPSDMLVDRDWLVELIRQVHRLRFLASGGLLKSIFVDDRKKLTDKEMIYSEDDIESEGNKVGERWYWWESFLKHYVAKKNCNS